MKLQKQKCPSGNSERWLHSNEMFIAIMGSQDPNDSWESSLIPQGFTGVATSESNKYKESNRTTQGMVPLRNRH